MSLCIVYYSRTGVTEKLASAIASLAREELGIEASLHRVRPVKEYSKPLHLNPRLWSDTLGSKLVDVRVEPPLNLSTCSALVLAAPIWIGRVAPPMTSFVKRELRRYRGSVLCVATSRFGRYCRVFLELLRSVGIEGSRCIDVIDRVAARDPSGAARRVLGELR
ncbi:MAG: flavodoxin family protein [Crenarchaeota archaeon]|nr:flavodoxin family protein [Thermoproteota archaeon]